MANTWPDRYTVHQSGRSGMKALVTDMRTHEIVLSLNGPDRFEVADAIARVLNASRSEDPIASSKYENEVIALGRLRREGYVIERFDGLWIHGRTSRRLHGWMLLDPDGAQLMIGEHGGVAPTKDEAIAEGLRRIAADERVSA